MKLSNDAPINDKSADEYGWSLYAKNVAGVLRSADASGSSFVASIQGPWGSGKTSFLHLIENELAESDGHNGSRVVWFNPWLFQSELDLLASFFRLLSEETGLEDTERGRRIAAKLKEYSLAVLGDGTGLLQLVLTSLLSSNPAAGPLAIVSSSIAKRMISSRREATPRGSLLVLKAELDEELRKMDRKLYVFFDDLDRLSKEELRLVFKTVSLTASFPNIVYVLAFDGDVVTRALAEVQGFDGNAYLEKIVQLPIDVPSLNQSDVLLRVNRLALELYEEGSFEPVDGERSRLIAAVRGLLIPHLTTPRQFARFENALQAKRLQVNDEICPVDLLGMVAVQLFMPEIFGWIRNNAPFLCGLEQLDFISDNRGDDGGLAGLAELIENCGVPAQTVTEGLAALFPRVAPERRNLSFSQELRSKLHSGRVRNAALFQHFLGYEAPTALSHACARAAVETADNAELRECLESEWKHGDLCEILWMIEDDLDRLAEERVCLLVKSLAPYLAKCKLERPTLVGPLGFDCEFSRLLLLCSRRFDTERLTESFVSAVMETHENNLVALARMLGNEAASRASNGPNTWMADEGFAKLVAWYSSRVSESLDDVLFSGFSEPLVACRMAEEIVGGNVCSRFLESLDDSPDRAALYSASLIAYWSGSSGEGFSIPEGSLEEFSKRLQAVRNFAESERLLAASSKAQVRIMALLALLEMAEEGIGDGRISRDKAFQRTNAARAALGAGPIEDDSQVW